MKLLGRLLDGLMDFMLIALGIPAAIAESAINRRSWTDRIADRVVERMQAQQPRMNVTNVHSIRNGETFAERHPELFVDDPKRAQG